MSDITIFGKTNFRNEQKKFGIKTDDRRRHMYLIGKTGMGKTVTMENMIIQDIERGKGVCVVDPHGDMVEKLINYIPEKRIKDVIYFEHNPDAVKSAEAVGIAAYYYDKDKKDLESLKIFLDKNL